MLQDRLTRQPYLDMLAAVQSLADAETALDDHSKNNEVRKAMIAKSSAFLYAVGRRYDAGAAAPFGDEAARRSLTRAPLPTTPPAMRARPPKPPEAARAVAAARRSGSERGYLAGVSSSG